MRTKSRVSCLTSPQPPFQAQGEWPVDIRCEGVRRPVGRWGAAPGRGHPPDGVGGRSVRGSRYESIVLSTGASAARASAGDPLPLRGAARDGAVLERTLRRKVLLRGACRCPRCWHVVRAAVFRLPTNPGAAAEPPWRPSANLHCEAVQVPLAAAAGPRSVCPSRR